MKLIYYSVIAVVVGFVVWRYWRQIRQAVLQFIESIRKLLDRLFGARSKEAAAAQEQAEALAAQPRHPAFSEFANPFAPGAERQTASHLVQHSFRAFEAWARERGVVREAEQTPIEFAASVAREQVVVDSEARSLAELYCRLSYAPQQLGKEVVQPIRSLWQKMTTLTPPPPPAPNAV